MVVFGVTVAEFELRLVKWHPSGIRLVCVLCVACFVLGGDLLSSLLKLPIDASQVS